MISNFYEFEMDSIEWNKILETELGEIKKSFSWPLKNIP
jgi:hypothetical protein